MPGPRDWEPPPFTLTEAGVLVRALQALDERLRITRLELHPALRPTDTPAPSTGLSTYVRGAEDVYHLLNHLPRPDLVPSVYLDAYTSALHARPFTNTDQAPFSAIRLLLPRLDEFCATNLSSFYQAAEPNIQPFPFLRLPTELRLRVYDYLAPKISHLELTPYTYFDSANSTTSRQRNRSPRCDLTLLRVSRKLNHEFVKHVYLNRVLFLSLAHDPNATSLSDSHFAYRYEALLSLRPSIRALLTHIEIEVGYLHRLLVHERRYHDIQIPSHPTDDAALRAFFALLPNLQSILLSFPISILSISSEERPYFQAQRQETLAWLRRCISEHVRLRWDTTLYDPFRPQLEGTQGLGPIEHGESIISYRYREHDYGLDKQVARLVRLVEMNRELERVRQRHALQCSAAPHCTHTRADFPLTPLHPS
jgi:hypothetical protein